MQQARYLVVSWALNAVVLAMVTVVFSGVTTDRASDLIVAAAVFGLLNTMLKPVTRLLTAPLALLTFGVAWFAVSMLMLWLTSVLVAGFDIRGFWTVVWATVTVWAVNCLFDVVEYFLRGGSTPSPVTATTSVGGGVSAA